MQSTILQEIAEIKSFLDQQDWALEYIINFDGLSIDSREEIAHLPADIVEFVEPDGDGFYVALCKRFKSDQCLTDMSHDQVLKTIGLDGYPELVIDCVEL